ncbi:MAG: VWA domain-containing protein, partial [Desulfobacterales bacterium]|nr:VWA domain-containing protein [Desulfobacterales bacterium]
WDERCAAMAAHAALGGVTIAQASEGRLLRRERELEKTDGLNPAALVGLLAPAVAGGLGALVRSWLDLLFNRLMDEVALKESVTVIKIIERIRRDHEPGLPADYHDKYGMVHPFVLPPDIRVGRMLQHALRLIEGIHGSEKKEDVVSLSDFRHWFGRGEDRPGSQRWMWLLRNMAKNGSPLMQGAAVMILEMEGEERLGPALGSWIDSAVCATSRAGLKKRIAGALLAGAVAFESCIQAVEETSQRIAVLDDRAFLDRLPALRGGFHCLSPAARERLLKEILITIDPDADRSGRLLDDPGELAALAAADAFGFERLRTLFPGFTPGATNLNGRSETGETPETDNHPAPGRTPLVENPDSVIPLADRWKLMLGVHREISRLPSIAQTANLMLDDIYGMGSGEGAASGGGGGAGAPRLTVRDWREDLAETWDSDVREEVLVEAALHGRGAAILELSPERVAPSVELLENILGLKGAIPESRVAGLRKLVDRVVSQLVRALAQRMAPALHGPMTQTPRRRRSSRLHLPRTVRANLHNLHEIDGRVQIIPENLYFRARQQRRMDWRLILVVDVSGSMEASVIHSALMATIFARLPALSVHFLACSTEVIDFTHRVDDPLTLLLEVSVGGGTDIGKGLAEARSRIKVPSRTMVVLISDFEEGVSTGRLLGEVSLMHASGARLLGLASLDASGKPRWHKGIAERVAAAGMPVAALGPRRVAAWVREQMS